MVSNDFQSCSARLTSMLISLCSVLSAIRRAICRTFGISMTLEGAFLGSRTGDGGVSPASPTVYRAMEMNGVGCVVDDQQKRTEKYRRFPSAPSGQVHYPGLVASIYEWVWVRLPRVEDRSGAWLATSPSL